MRPKSIKKAEWYVLNYLITGEGADLTDLADDLGVSNDKVVEKRYKTACANIHKVLTSMISKRPEPEVDSE